MRSKKSKAQIDHEDRLAEAALTISTINCCMRGCSAIVQIAGDDIDCGQEAYEKGWRIDKDDFVYCPKHIAARKKKK